MSDAFITATAVDHELGNRPILEQIDLAIHTGDRIALVGRNGSGKSTLLRLLAGLETPTGGEIRRDRGLRVAWLPQLSGVTLDAAGERTVREELAVRTGVDAAARRMEAETERLASGDLSRIEAQPEAVENWTRLGGPDLDARIGQALEQVRIDSGWADRRLDSLSGGQLARINLATLQLSRIDLALLDEPANHLDTEGLAMLRELLESTAPAIVMAAHDRGLLEGFASDVVELERGRARRFRGGWQVYLREKEAAHEKALGDWEEAAAEKRRLAEMERRIRQQAEAGERRARRSREPDKFIRHMAVQSAQKNTAISGIAKRNSQLELPEKPWQEGLSTLLLDAADAVHAPQLALIHEAVLARGEWRSRPLTLSIAPGERVLLTGPNGSGKSSLIGALAGRLRPVAGSIAIPASVRVTELAQQASVFHRGEGSLTDRFRQLSGLDETAARTALAAMKLGPDQAGREPSSLSPGELTRAELALLARRGAACLLLDEPGNHLDIEALEVLELALEGWPGALVLASHDQAFRNAVRFDREVNFS